MNTQPNHLQKFFAGAFAPARGMRLLMRRPALMRLAITPFILTIVIFVGSLALLPWLFELLHAGVSKTQLIMISGWAGKFLFWFTLIVAWFAGLIALLYVTFLVTRLVAAPFYGLLAEKTMLELHVIEDSRFRLFSWLALMLKMLRVSVARVLLFGFITVLLFIVSFVPGLGIFTSIGFLLMVAFDVSDYAFEALQMGLRPRFAFFQRHMSAFFGFGAVMGLAFMIPGLNFFLLPASVVGACDMVRRLRQSEMSA